MRTLIPIFCLICLIGCDPPSQQQPISDQDMSNDQTVDAPPDLVEDQATDQSNRPDLTADLTQDMPIDQSQDLLDMPTSTCGDSTLDPNEACDDGNLDNGDECSSTCQRTYACDTLPMSCQATNQTTTEHAIKRISACEFALTPWSSAKQATRRQLIDAIRANAKSVSVEAIFQNLNRAGIKGISAQNAERLKNHNWSGFRWNSGDESVAYWYPQGITGSADAHNSGLVDQRRLVMVSWYNKTDARPTKGVRISLADITDLNAVKYRHLLLVEPTGTPANPSFKVVETASGNALHAGGIVWLGNLLYVADTTGGLRVFDLSTIIQTNAFDKDLVGFHGQNTHAHGYAYAIPEITRYTLHKDSCPVRFSFVSLDRTSTPPALITGEYRKDDHNGRLVIWPLDPTTHAPDVRQGEVRAMDAFIGGQTRMQGATRLDGNLYISSSSQYQRFGRLYRTKPGHNPSSISAWVYGAEDLYVDTHRNLIWTAAEHPGARDVVSIPIRLP